MKKLLALLLALTLVGCSSEKTPEPTVTPTTTPTAEATPDATPSVDPTAFVGETGAYGTPNVIVTMDGEKIATLVIDEIDADGVSSKKEMGDTYAPDAFPAGSWSTQVAALEAFIIENGVEAVELDETGKVTNEDLKTSVTIAVSDYVATVNAAIAALSAE